MRAWLAAAMAATLLMGGAAPGGLAPCSDSVAAPEASLADRSAEVPRTLARFAGAAYDDGPATVPPSGFRPATLAGLSLRGGRFANGSAKALVLTGELDGVTVLVVGFRGSAGAEDWLADLRNIDASYLGFRPLVRAVERYAAAGGSVVVVGHSAGGTMAQLFMYEHAGDAHYRAMTFGSPGALPQAHVFAAQADARITNYAIPDDPYVFLGEHRAEVASYARRDRVYALALAGEIAQQSGLSLPQIMSSEPYLSANYVNNGVKVLLPGRRSVISIRTVIAADPEEHEIDTYVARVGAGSGTG